MPTSRDHPLLNVAHETQPRRRPPAYAPAGFCPGCGYRMDAGRCPECGRRIRRAARVHPRVRRRRVVRLAAAAILAAITFVALLKQAVILPFLVTHLPSAWLAPFARDPNVQNWARTELQRRLSAAFLVLRLDQALHTVRSTATTSDVALTHHNGVFQQWSASERLYQQFRMLEAPAAIVFYNDAFAWTVGSPNVAGAALLGRAQTFAGGRIMLQLSVDRHVLRMAPSVQVRDTYVCVAWEDWAYLVAPDELVEFCNDVNAGEYLPAYYFTRGPPALDLSDLARVSGRPNHHSRPRVLAECAERLLDEPIAANVVARTDPPTGADAEASPASWVDTTTIRSRVETTRLTIDRGAADGVQIGMRFYRAYGTGFGTVISRSDNDATLTWVELTPPHVPHAILSGDRVSTLAPPLPLPPERNPPRPWEPDSKDSSEHRWKPTFLSTRSPAHIAWQRIPYDTHVLQLRAIERELRSSATAASRRGK